MKDFDSSQYAPFMMPGEVEEPYPHTCNSTTPVPVSDCLGCAVEYGMHADARADAEYAALLAAADRMTTEELYGLLPTRSTQTEHPNHNAPFTDPGSYRIEHRFQRQDDDEFTNTGQYVQIFEVDTWEDIGPAIINAMTHCDGMGFTVSISIMAKGA